VIFSRSSPCSAEEHRIRNFVFFLVDDKCESTCFEGAKLKE
jgi:hypothetical protein